MTFAMTMIAVSIAVHSADEVGTAIERAAGAVRKGATLVEWRIDALAEEADALPAAGHLVSRSPAPCIVTCRTVDEGGEYHGDEQTRMSIFEALAVAGFPPRYIDVELTAYRRSMNLRQKVHLAVDHPDQPRDLNTSLILSAHDVSGRPPDLMRRIETMIEEPACAIVKLAWHARSLRDNLEAFELLATRRKPMIALCMGPFGLMSRVLAPKFGGFLTFASDSRTELTAPGQPTVEELRGLYRFDQITPKTRVYGVIGWPVEHSLSPVVHNAGFDAIDHDGVYLPLPIPPEYEHFKATVGALIDAAGLDFHGASVTMPHKVNLLRFVRERGGRTDELTDQIGAANTLIVGSAGGLSCTNTDGPAAVAALCAGMNLTDMEIAGLHVAVIGAGGMARAITAGLVRAGGKVVVFNRDEARAAALVNEFQARSTAGGDSPRIELGRREALACGCFDVFINCTPMGMRGGPAPDESPLPDDVPLNDRVTVFDTVYAVAVGDGRTPLIQEAESRGARVITGLDMFMRQAALQFELWTGKPAPLNVFRRALEGK
jgi:3-dehydroquinate dehydratase/shikimate dehydrogenase